MPPQQISSYTITHELGKGSMGVVYEGVPKSGGRPVAIKVFYPDTQLTPEETGVLLERFEREGSALSQVSHRNIVHILEVGTEQNLEFIVMEKLEGYNLKDLFTLGTRFTLAETFDIILQLLDGLAACHQAGIIHRDVKPANVVKAPDGVLKLTDFGIARVITDATLSRKGTIVGTPNYMSPEQIRGEDVDPRTDLFSAGVLFYELLTAHKPFEGPDVTAIMYNVTNIHPPSPRFYNGALPVELDEMVFKALAKKRDERFSTAREFATALRQLEQSLHYRDDTEAVLNALPADPDPDSAASVPARGAAAGSAAVRHGGTAGVASLPTRSSQLPSGLPATGSIVPGVVYCIDCGMENDESAEFCKRCLRVLVKRDMASALAAQQAKLMHKMGRADYLFLTCLSVVIVFTVLLILYLFFRSVF
jgi:eukaryotic-like serine/threonine-protein kinase